MVDRSIVWIGTSLVVRYMRYRGRFPARDFFIGAEPAVRARFIALAKVLADSGVLPDRAHGHYLKAPFQDIFELKPRNCRFYGFFHLRNYYITNGGPKANPKVQLQDHERAEQMRKDFLAGLGKGRAKP